MKKNLLFALILLPVSLFSLEPIKTGNPLKDNALLANRTTALRCLNNANSYLNDKNWSAVYSQSELGISYDDSISDLWYLKGLALSKMEETKANIIPLLKKAIDTDKWVNYNRDNSILMYADLLCDTGDYKTSLILLDENSKIFSKDAEYVRIKALYRTKDDGNILKARNKIDGARNIYPEDFRFPLAFFTYENKNSRNQDIERLTNFFITQILKNKYNAKELEAELEILAADFASGKDKEILLKSFAARDLRHPLYPIVALESGLISEEKAFEYFSTFLDESVDFTYIKRFVSLITEKEIINKLQKYFNAYSGTIFIDTDEDKIFNLQSKYVRGRPQSIIYDQNQDGKIEWTIRCDFGVPVFASLNKNGQINISWNDYPFLSSVEFGKNSDEEKSIAYKFNLVHEKINWSPIKISVDEDIKELTDLDFYVASTEDLSRMNEPEKLSLINNSSTIEITTEERGGTLVTFDLIDGKIIQTHYFNKGKNYAQGIFKNNIPLLRSVDADDDGIFETTEFYELDTNYKMDTHQRTDEKKLLNTLFQFPPEDQDFYLKMVQIDRNKDTVPDFSEEYLENNGKISSWDTDNDGMWNVRHTIFGKAETDENLLEESSFYDMSSQKLITISYINGIPSEVKNGEEILSVVKDNIYDIYWILKNQKYNEDDLKDCAKKITNTLNSLSEQGISSLIEDNEKRILCIKIGKFNFALMIEELQDTNEIEDEE